MNALVTPRRGFVAGIVFAVCVSLSVAGLTVAPAQAEPGSAPVAPVPEGAASSNTMAMSPAADGSDANPIVAEDVGQRGEFSKTFTTTDGSFEAAVYPFPVHYRNGGKWQDIDNSLISATDPIDNTAVLDNTANPTGVQFAKKSTSSKLVTVTTSVGKVSWYFDGQAKVDASVDATTPAGDNATGNQKKLALANIASGLTYAGLFPGVDVHYANVSNSVKESIVLHDTTAQHTFTTLVSTGKLQADRGLDGSVSLADPSTGVIVFRFAAPYMSDAGGAVSQDVTVTLTPAGPGVYRMTLKGDDGWLADPGRVWPVTIDPSVTSALDASQIQDTMVTSTSPNTSGSALADMGVGVAKSGQISRSVVKFTTLPTIPGGWYKITGATLRLTSYTTGTDVNNFTANPQIAAYQFGGTFAVNTITWSGFGWDGFPANGLSASPDSITTINTAGQHFFDITPTVRNWYTYANTNNGLVLKLANEATPTTDQMVWFATSDWTGKTAADYPMLTINYANDTTAPTPSVAFSATVPASGWYTSAPTLTFNASDTESGVKTVTYSVTGAVIITNAATTVGGTWKPTAAGSSSVTETATDASGNKATTTASFNYDPTAPIGSITVGTAVPASGWYQTAPTVTFNASDANSGVKTVTYSVTGATTITNVATTAGGTWKPTVAGTNTITETVTDIAGNTYTTPATTIKYDPAAPAASITASAAAGTNGWYTTAPTLTFNATDAASGVKTVTYSVTGAASVTNASTSAGGTYKPTTPGSYVITETVTDNAGNTSTATSAINYNPTTVPLSIAISPTAPDGLNGWYKTAPTLTFNASDPGGIKTMTYQVSGQRTVPATATTNGSTWKPPPYSGSYTVTLTATNNAGTVATAVQTFQYDDAAPIWALSLDATTSSGWYASDWVNWSVGGGGGGTLLMARGAFTAASFPVATARPASRSTNLTQNGVYTFYAENSAGIPGVAQITLSNVDIPTPLTGYTTSYTDLSVPAPGFDTAFTRTYDSTNTTTGPLGKGWSMPYRGTCLDYSYVNDAGGTETLPAIKVVQLPGVAAEYFSASGTTFTGVNTRDALVKNTDGTFTLTSVAHTVYTFDATGFLTKMADLNGNIVTITLNTNHLPIQVQDPVGRVFTIGYNANNLATTITDPAGRTFGYTYNSSNQLASQTSPTGASINSYSYDTSGRLVKILDALGNPDTTIVYDGNNQVYTVTDNVKNKTTSYSYSTTLPGPVTITTTAPDGASSVVYDAWGRQSVDTGSTQYTYAGTYLDVGTSTDSSGNTTTNLYDTHGSLTSATTVDSTGGTTLKVTTSYTYTGTVATGSVETAITYDPSSSYAVTDTKVTTSTYDTKGNLTRQEVKDTAGGATTDQITTSTYNANGTVATKTDPDGTTTTNTYDTYGNTTGTTTAKSGSATLTSSSTYDVIGEATSETDTSGAYSQYSYDLLGNVVVQALTRNGSYLGVSRSVYDSYGRLTFSIPVGQGYCAQDTRTANAAGLITVNTCTGTPGTSYSYDQWGNTALLNQYGRITRSVYNAQDQLLQQIGPDQYDPAADNLTANTYGNPNVGNRYTYDTNANPLTHTDRAGNTTTNTYDTSGALVKSVCAGQTTRYVYDTSGNLTQTVYPNQYNATYDGLTKTPATNTYTAAVGDRYTYDTNGLKLTFINSQNVETDYTYDDAGYLAKEVTNQQVTRHIYDTAGNLIQTVYPNQYNATYDGLTKTPATNTYTAAVGDRYTYDTSGHVISHTDSNGKVTTSVYDADSTLNNTAASDGTKQTYDPAGNILTDTLPNASVNTYSYTATQTVKSIVGSNGISATFSYDTSAHPVGYTFAAATSKQYTYTYDVNANIASMSLNSAPLASYQYNPAGELAREDNKTQNQTTTYSYDAVGNITGKTVFPYTTTATPTGATSSSTNTYNAANQLTGWQGATLSYDTTGNLLGLSGATFTWKNGRLSGQTAAGQATSYSYGASNIRTSKNVAGTITNYTTGDDNQVIEQNDGKNDLKFVRGSDGTPQYFTLNATTYYYERDLQGDVTGILNTNKQEIVTYSYDAWGKLLTIAGSAATTIGTLNPIRYKGYYYDNESGLYYLQNRYYSPDLARFISPDQENTSNTQTQPLGSNLYVYCADNPVMGTDPTGTAVDYYKYTISNTGIWTQEAVTFLVIAPYWAKKVTPKVPLLKVKASGILPDSTKKQLVTAKQLKTIGFVASVVTAAMVFDLNRMLYKYDIKTPKQKAMLLGQCMKESAKGKDLTERPSKYASSKSIYKGAGFIQFSGSPNYLAFSKYIKKSTGKADADIMNGGATYVSAYYPWESAGWWWKDNGINALLKKLDREKRSIRTESNLVSRAVNYGNPYNSKPALAEPERWGYYRKAAAVFGAPTK